MSDEDCIRRFMEMALDDVRCLEVMREWYDGLSGSNPPLLENEMLLFDTRWVLQQMGRPDRTAILLEVMVENNMVHPHNHNNNNNNNPNVVTMRCLRLVISFSIS